MSGRSFLRAFLQLALTARKNSNKIMVFNMCWKVFGTAVLVVFFALLAAPPRERTLKNHENHMVFIVFGACRPFARGAEKRTKEDVKRRKKELENASKKERRKNIKQ